MLAKVEAGIGWLTFNNPERRNAFTLEMLASIPPILRAFQDDAEVRVVVVTGAGDEAFGSGADISEFEQRGVSAEARAKFDSALEQAAGAWRTLEKPTIAMIRGYCLGGGLTTAIAADIRVAAEGSVFGIPAARLGVAYPPSALEPLAALVGPAWAAEILFTGSRLSAAEALRIGLINHLVAVADLEAAVVTMATTIAENAPLTVRAAKLGLRELHRAPQERDGQLLSSLAEACYRSGTISKGSAHSWASGAELPRQLSAQPHAPGRISGPRRRRRPAGRAGRRRTPVAPGGRARRRRPVAVRGR